MSAMIQRILFIENDNIMKNLPSFFTSMTSLIVMLLAICVMVMGLMNFWRTGEVLDIFNSLVSAFVGAYLQRSISNNTESPIAKSIEPEVPSAPLIEDDRV